MTEKEKTSRSVHVDIDSDGENDIEVRVSPGTMCKIWVAIVNFFKKLFSLKK